MLLFMFQIINNKIKLSKPLAKLKNNGILMELKEIIIIIKL